MKNKSLALTVRNSIIFLLIIAVFADCARRRKSELVWGKNLPRIGSQSSPRATDLNGDGTLDIVMGAGQNEYQQSEQGILALDGATGELLWQAGSQDQVYGSATLYDVTGDGINDVFIGGRSPHFRALNGKNGELLWEYKYKYENDPVLRHARFNFNNSVLIPDQNGDGFSDLLTANGGNSRADRYSAENRFPGVLIIFDSKTGNIIAADTMPDGGESYMSPLCFPEKNGQDPIIIFGTGGETISGNLYKGHLSDLIKNQLYNAKIIASEKGHGFIAPPVIADVNDDDHPDIFAISHGSTLFGIDGKNGNLLWKNHIPGSESSNSFAVGYFNNDNVPDFFTFVSKGEWPNSTGSLQIMLDGKDGRIAFMDSIGCTGFSSPVVYDIDYDGIDEAIISINEYDCAVGFTGKTPRVIENKLIAINFKARSIQTIDQTKGFKNIFSTPWIGDLDDDGYLDIVHCQYFHTMDLLSFLGMRIKRIATPIKMKGDVLWGSYMGTLGDGLFRKSI
jgi:outer membrane protein assembly factor BamB